jgi:catechol 2,3-dioxygenase-like lactoylglutathione lyase family enzyme
LTKTIFDHVAIGTRALTDGWDLFGGVLGGAWVYGGESAGFWWGQLQYLTGPKIELLTPTPGPDSAFLERFLTRRGPGPHHLNFIVPDIGSALSRVRALGIEAVKVNLRNPNWKEAFLRPSSAFGIAIQVAEQAGPPPVLAAPAELPDPGPSSAFALVEHHVDDIGGATRLFQEALEGELVSLADTADGSVAELTWHDGARLRLRQTAPAVGDAGLHIGGAAGHLHFVRPDAAFSPADLRLAADLSKRLGVSLQLGG